jgi:dTDP-4-dehydrorhamnose reductase
MHIVILGGTGMLGSMLADVFSRDNAWSITATAQSPEQLAFGAAHLPQVRWQLFKVTADSTIEALAALGPADWYLNAIGLTKPYTHDDNFAEIARAIRVNAAWPLELAEYAGQQGAQILQIGTDCVYQGLQGHYVETDLHDATDVYGKTKSLGEAVHAATNILRASIIGPEPKDDAFLLAWLLGQAPEASVNGFTNHLWNGVTTLHFARAAAGIIKHQLALPHVQHLIPGDVVTKARLLDCMCQSYQRTDIAIKPTAAVKVIDRTLATTFNNSNLAIWQAAGYAAPPTIATMLDELASYRYAFGKSVAG